MFSVCGSSISQTENTNQSQPKEKPELSLKMERFGCNGRCPAYDLTIQPDGKIIFDGKFWTELTGKAEGKLTENQLKQLIDEIENAKFFSLDNAYNFDSKNCPIMATDMPRVKLHVKLNDKEKTIDHDLGCWGDNREEKQGSNSNEVKTHSEDITKKIFPQQLYILENKINEIADTKRWIGERK